MNAGRKHGQGRGQMIAVFGAAGHTGRFVVAELLRRGLTPIAVARDSAKLKASGLPDSDAVFRTASVEDPASLDRAFAGAAAVINCAGPFLDTADVVIAAALRAGAHYLDVTAEQPSALATFEKYGAAARAAKLVVMPAMGFYGGFGDLLATAAMGDWDRADEIRIGIALDSWHPTAGTRTTGARNTARRVIIENGRLTPVSEHATETSWDFPAPFGHQDVTEVPFSEVVLIAKHLRVAQLHTFLNNVPLRDIRNPTTPPPKPVDETGRSPQIFMVDAIVRKGGHTRRATARGRDIYAFTAPFICEAVQRILGGDARENGVQAPGAIFDAPAYLQALTTLTLEIGGTA